MQRFRNKCDEQENNEKRTSLVSKNINVSGKRTSVRLEPEMWCALQEIAKREECTIHDICNIVNARKKPDSSLTASIRVFLMLYFRSASTEDGHSKAGHGHFSAMIQRAKINLELLGIRQKTYGQSQNGEHRISA